MTLGSLRNVTLRYIFGMLMFSVDDLFPDVANCCADFVCYFGLTAMHIVFYEKKVSARLSTCCCKVGDLTAELLTKWSAARHEKNVRAGIPQLGGILLVIVHHSG